MASSGSAPSSPATPSPKSLKTPVITHSANGFTPDDAFSEGDDSPTFKSSNVLEDIAEDLRKSHLARNGYEQSEDKEDTLQDPDASVSTIDINGSPSDNATSSSVRSLDEDGPQPWPPGSRDSTDSHSYSEHRSSSSADGSHSSFPSVVIDLTKPQDSQITILSTESKPVPDASSPTSGQHPATVGGSMVGTRPPPLSPLSLTRSMPSHLGATGSKSPVHRQTKSTAGPSALEKVISKTRPTYLPPKQKDEDNKHLADWEEMMQRSRAAGEIYLLLAEIPQLIFKLRGNEAQGKVRAAAGQRKGDRGEHSRLGDTNIA